MAPLVDKPEALRRLEEMIAASTKPVIDDVEPLLNQFAVGVLWEAATLYAVGDIVQPTSLNRTGRRYKCVTAGTSGATEPTWPTVDYGRVTDGTTCVFEEAGVERDLWDLNAAAARGWALKLALASRMASVAIGDNRKEAQQVFEHCRIMSLYYAPIQVA